MGESYQWDFGSAASGLQFKVVFDGTSFKVTCTSGYLDLNALWFSDGDKLVEGTVTLTKSDNSLNMNGTGVTWDDVYKVSSTGLGSAGVNKASFLTTGESMSFSLATLDLPPAITALLASDPRLLTLGVRVTSDSSLSGEGKYVDTSGTLISSVNHAPTLDTVSNGTVTDTAGDDTYSPVTGTLHGSDSDGNTMSFKLAGSAATSGTGDSLGFDVQKSSAYGTFYLNTTSGAYKFVANDAAVEGLKTTQAVDFTVSASDGTADSATQTISISLKGVNDTPGLNASLTAHTYVDTSGDDTFDSVTGNLSTVERDASDTAAYTIDGSGVATGSFDVNGHTYQQKLVGSFGTLYLDTSGAYEYVPNDGAIEALEASTSENFTLKVTDGSGATDTKTLTINLTGAEDAPVVTAVVAGYTDTAADDTFNDATGTLSVSSRDGDTSFTFALAGSSTTGQLDYDLQDTSSSFGTLYLNSTSGAYKFVANDAAIEALESGNNPSAVYHVTAAADGATSASQTITINLTGAEDAPVVTAVVAGYTDTAADDTFDDTTGTLSVSSRDGDTSFTFALAGSSTTGQLDYDLQDTSSSFGTLYLNSTTGAYKFVANDAAIEALESGNNPSAVYHVTAAADGATSASQTITINLTGAEDAPVVTAVVAGYTDTAADDTFDDTTGTLSVSSRDGDTSFTFALAGSSTTGQLDYDLQDTSSSFGTLYLNSTTGAYKFVANDAAIEALESGNNPSAVYHVTAAADGATSASQTITINLTGAEDAPVVAPVVASYTDTAADNTFADTIGTLGVTSRDLDTSFTFALAGSSASLLPGYDRQDASSTYGTLYLNSTSGAYKFVANDANVEALEAGNNPSAIYHVTAAADGATSASQTITINFTGAEDAPVVASVVASYTDTAADDTFADKTGTLAVTSRDGDTSFSFALAGSSSSGISGYDLQNTSSAYGTLYLSSTTGAYKFIANDAAIEALQAGSTPSVVYNVTAAADGVTSASQTFTLNLTGANDAPRDLSMAAVSFAGGNGIPGAGGTIGTISVPAIADPDAGGSYSYSIFSAKVGLLGDASVTTSTSQFAISDLNNTGVLSTSSALASGSIYEVTVQVSQGTGAAQATYNETFSIVTGTNAGTESLPGGGYDFSSGDDVIYGRQNVDIILAGSGNDTVFGQDGNDEIHGGTGVDLLYGGKDNDSFVFSTGDTGITLATADTIGDFNSANDTIVTSLNPGNVTIANGSALADFNAFVSAANAVMASNSANNGAYMAWNAAGSGNGWLVIDENHSGAVDTGDSLIVLTGVNTAGGFSTTDIA
ncbi:VCBS domain-containing protein [Pseudomonas sp. SCB32]|uniref:beta strand repeat-containing protein n=1 Tax=Pseudomonas sp. SCB32 TaxID=2653853 RepID=UPI00126577A9|nr:VCBS domain-containing protein [Pseudomonas sp. SCB32]